jgi:DNA-binding LacI/PurR family transcriptional regulator
MAVAGLGAAQRLGVDVPADLSIVAWDDSVLCELVHPALTTLTHDIVAYGAHAARVLLDRLAGAEPGVSQGEAVPLLTVRASTARAR